MAADLEFRIGAELTEIKGALASLQRDLQSVGQAAEKAGNDRGFQKLESSARSAVGAVGRLVAGFVTLAAVIKTISAADELNSLNARLKLVTNSTDELTRAQVALFELSQRTRSSLGETVDLYTKIANATKEAGVGQETLLQVVETVNQAVQLSGAGAQAAQAALTQLGQGLASGTLRGDELNSVLEQTPALADAIAKGMGITRGELRKYGEEGKITAEQVINALQAQREEVARQFGELPITVGQSITMLRNAGLQIVGAFDGASSATAGLAEVIRNLAEFLSSDQVIGAVIEFSAAWSRAFANFVEDAKEAARIFGEATQDITGSGEDVIDILGRAFRELPVNIRTSIQIVTVQAAALFDRLVSYAQFVKDNFKAIFTDDTQDASYARFKQRNEAIAGALRSSVEQAFVERDAALNEARKAREEALKRREQGRQNTGANGRGTFTSRPSDADERAAAQLAKARLDAEEKLLDDASKRQLRILEQQFDDAQLAAEGYYRKREELELAAIDRSIAIERQRAQAGGVDQVKALAEIELLERRKTDIQTQAARDRANFLRRIETELEQARITDLTNSGQGVEAAKLRLEAQYRDLIKRLQAEGNTEGVKLIQNLINSGVAKAQFDEIKGQFDRVVADMRARQQQIADQVSTGDLAPGVASAEQSAARQRAIAELQALNEQLQEVARNTNNPEIIRGAEEATNAIRRIAIDSLTGIDAAIADLRGQLQKLQDNFAQAATGAGVDAITGLFTDLASGTKSAKEALADFVRGFVQSMAQIAARALATYIVLQTLDAVYPGLGKAVAGTMAVGANVQHSGGMVGTGPRRMVNPLMFAGAPRYHSGGMVGLKPDERPAILQTGEEVLSRGDPRNQANGGGGGGNGTRIINVIDPSLVSDYLASSAGEKTVLNVLQRNPGAVRQVLA